MKKLAVAAFVLSTFSGGAYAHEAGNSLCVPVRQRFALLKDRIMY